MSILNVAIDDYVEQTSVPEGEYELRITSTPVEKESKNGEPMVKFVLEIIGNPTSKLVSFFLMLPYSGQDARAKNVAQERYIKFCKAFGYAPGAPVNIEEMVGDTAWAFLREEESEEYGKQNSVRGWLERK